VDPSVVPNREAQDGNDRTLPAIRFESLVEDPQHAIGTWRNSRVQDLPILHGRRAPLPRRAIVLLVVENGMIDRTRARVEVGTLSPDERLRLAVAVGDAAAALGYAVPA
jgi:hypothetical protein